MVVSHLQKLAMMQCASMEVGLTASAQEASQLRVQVAMLETELAAHESSPDMSGSSSSSAAYAAELTALRAEKQQKEQQVAELQLQLEAALHASAGVSEMYSLDTQASPEWCMPQLQHVIILSVLLYGTVRQSSTGCSMSQCWYYIVLMRTETINTLCCVA